MTPLPVETLAGSHLFTGSLQTGANVPIRRRPITNREVEEIQRRAAAGQSQVRIAEDMKRARSTIQNALRPSAFSEDLKTDPNMEPLDIRDPEEHSARVAERLRHAERLIDAKGLAMVDAGPWAVATASAMVKTPDYESLLPAFRRYMRARYHGWKRRVPPLPTWDEFLNASASRRRPPTRR